MTEEGLQAIEERWKDAGFCDQAYVDIHVLCNEVRRLGAQDKRLEWLTAAVGCLLDMEYSRLIGISSSKFQAELQRLRRERPA
jgi:hypothetical protein